MNFENIKSFEDTDLGVKNEMQARLAIKMLEGNFDDEKAVENMILENSDVFRSVISEHPEYIDGYRDDPEGMLDKIREEVEKFVSAK